jgi:hypothetical protein
MCSRCYNTEYSRTISKNSTRSGRNLVDGCCISGWGLLSFGLVLVKLHELGEVKLGLLEDLDLSDHAVVLERIDLRALSLDLLANFFFDAKLIN